MMGINWGKVDARKIADKAGDNAGVKLANEISSLTNTPDSEIERWFPSPTDKERLVGLLKAVNQAEDSNAQQKVIIDNITQFAGTVVTILKRLV